jgi:RNA polymerase sigma factor (sigma-70 family)
MLAARERFGLTQRSLASIAGVDMSFIGRLEAMNFSDWHDAQQSNVMEDRLLQNKLTKDEIDQRLRRVADALELQVDDIMPDDLSGHKVETTVTRCCEVDAMRLRHLKCLTLPSTNVVETAALQSEAKDKIANAMRFLSYREREIIKLRYGLDDEQSLTLEEVGHVFKLTHARVQQIEQKGLRKMLRHITTPEDEYTP